MENKLYAGLAIVLGVLLIISAISLGYALNKAPEIKTIAVEKEVVVQVPVVDNKTTELYNYFADDIQDKKDVVLRNDTAKTLALAEIATRDFKRSLVTLFNDNAIENQSVEDYKDLEIYYSDITDVDLSGESAEVQITIKVNGYNADDQEDDFKARLYITIDVSDLDVEDNFGDAEAEVDSIELSKFY